MRRPVYEIYISLSDLDTVNTQLQSIIEEFENAVDRYEALEEAIGNPFGRGELRDEAQDFEERWDNKRDPLKEGLKDVREHVAGDVNTIEKSDRETADESSSAQTRLTALPLVAEQESEMN